MAAKPATLERLSSNDLMALATDAGRVPMQLGAVLVLHPARGGTAAEAAGVIGDRLARIPRLRQRLLVPVWPAGRPLWVDDPGFAVAHHLHRARIAAPVTDDALMGVAAGLVCTRLSRDRPLWAAGWTDELPDGGLGVVLVLHHALADGMGGLAILAAIGDGAAPLPPAPPPRPWPDPVALRSDAMRSRSRALRETGPAVRRTWAGMRELGLTTRAPRLAARTSLTGRTGTRRVIAPTTVPLAPVVAAGRRHGATVNDVVVTAAAGALFALLADRGERPAHLIVSVPIARLGGDAAGMGNRVGALPVAVPRSGDPGAQLHAVAAATRRAKTGRRGTSASVLGAAFRTLAAFGVVQLTLDHQRLVHTFETNLRGPDERVRIAGWEVARIVPFAVNPGNVGVSFDVLSYAGDLVVSIVTDPAIVPDPDVLLRHLHGRFEALTHVS